MLVLIYTIRLYIASKPRCAILTLNRSKEKDIGGSEALFNTPSLRFLALLQNDNLNYFFVIVIPTKVGNQAYLKGRDPRACTWVNVVIAI